MLSRDAYKLEAAWQSDMDVVIFWTMLWMYECIDGLVFVRVPGNSVRVSEAL